MSFLQSSDWTFASTFQNPQAFIIEPNYRKASYDVSNHSTRKDSTDSLDFKFKYKTEVCKYWLNGQICPFQNFCSFAHGFVQRRCREDLPSKYKTKICKNYLNNSYCPYGVRCQFLHPLKSIQQQNQKGKYQKLLKLTQQNLELFSVYSKRLKIFSELCERQAIKELFGEDQVQSILQKNLLQMIRNGKPRFYSI